MKPQRLLLLVAALAVLFAVGARAGSVDGPTPPPALDNKIKCATFVIGVNPDGTSNQVHLKLDKPVNRNDELEIRAEVTRAAHKYASLKDERGHSPKDAWAVLNAAATGSYSEGRLVLYSCGWGCVRIAGCGGGSGSWCVRVVQVN